MVVRRILRFLFISAIFFFSSKAFTQVTDSVYYFNFSGTGSINKTNGGTAYIFNNGVKFNIIHKNITVNTLNNWVFGENKLVKTNNDFLSVADVDLFKNRNRIYYWALASYERSYSLNINDRMQIGGGLGLNILTNKKAKLIISDGPLYEKTHLAQPDLHGRNSYETVRNSFRVKFRFVISDLFVIDGVDFLQNSLSDKNDYNIRSNTSFSFKINRWLSFATAVSYNRLNLTGNENFLFNYGLSVEKYF